MTCTAGPAGFVGTGRGIVAGEPQAVSRHAIEILLIQPMKLNPLRCTQSDELIMRFGAKHHGYEPW